MATPEPDFKIANGHHRPLVQRAERHLARQILAEQPELGDARAFAQATRALAEALGISRSRLVQIRQEGRVPSKHWFALERATAGAVKAADFERAANGGGG